MQKNTFVGLIKAIMDQKSRENTFAEHIKDAYVAAGECEDFRTPDSYLPPTNMLVDDIIEAIANDFVNEKQSKEGALDLINYFVYELDMMDYQFIEPKHPENPNDMEIESVPAYVEFSNGTKMPVDTPANLYEALRYGMEANPPASADHVDSKTELRSTLKTTNDQIKIDEIMEKLRPLVADHLGVEEDDVKPEASIVNDLGADSLDCVELVMKVENEFSIHFTDDEMDQGMFCTIDDLAKLIYVKTKDQ